MKLISSKQMKEIDEKAIVEYSIPGIILMENAGIKMVEVIKNIKKELKNLKVIIIVGKGNNGGDGLVIARHLINSEAMVDVFLLCKPKQFTKDATINFNILTKMKANIFKLVKEEDIERLMESMMDVDVIVDAIYGIGFKGSLDDFENMVVEMVNKNRASIVSVDISSGVEADTGKVYKNAIRANYTVTFSLPKIGQILGRGSEYVGELTIADISIPKNLLNDKSLKMNLIDEVMIKNFLNKRDDDSHKGTYGHVAIIGGSVGMSGAVILASSAALRSGAGLITAAVPKSLVSIVEGGAIEVMTKPLFETKDKKISLKALSEIENLLKIASVCAIGPGMGKYYDANNLIKSVIKKSNIPMLIDADGINALDGDGRILKEAKIPIVITPHPGELGKLTGLKIEEIQKNRLDVAKKYALEYGVILVLKGHKTIIASPKGEIFVNTTGNPGMATAGSGDVLSGIIIGLMAQGLNSLDASVVGVHIHGLAGDLVAERKGQRGLVASDLIKYLPYLLEKE